MKWRTSFPGELVITENRAKRNRKGHKIRYREKPNYDFVARDDARNRHRSDYSEKINRRIRRRLRRNTRGW